MNSWFVISRPFQHPQEIGLLRSEILGPVNPAPRTAQGQDYFAVFEEIDWRRHLLRVYFSPAASRELRAYLMNIHGEPCLSPLRSETMSLLIGDVRAWGMIR